MLTLNYNNYMYEFLTGHASTYTRSTGDTLTGTSLSRFYIPLGLSSASNEINTSTSSYNVFSTKRNIASSGYSGRMILGTDGTAESYEDYTVTPETNLTMDAYTYSYDYDSTEGKLVITLKKIATNDTDSDIEIKELGLFERVNTGSTYSSSSWTNLYYAEDVLFYRKVFDSPIVIFPNTTRLFRINFTVYRDFITEGAVAVE